jgi:outer membrane receptor protein involved in Fe transport
MKWFVYWSIAVVLATAVAASAQEAAPGESASPAAATGEKPQKEEAPRLDEIIVVSASRVQETLLNAPATISVLTSEAIGAVPAQNYGELLRAVPGINVVQLSARDVNIASRQAVGALGNSELVLLDGRSIYQDFFGFVLWDLVPINVSEIKQIEVIRGPASAVWGANAIAGVINILTWPPREAQGTDATFSVSNFGRRPMKGERLNPGWSYGLSAKHARLVNESWSFKVSTGYFSQDPFARPVGRIPTSASPVDPSYITGGGVYPAFPNQGTRQPKIDVRVDQELSPDSQLSYTAGLAETDGIIHTEIGPFDIQPGAKFGYGKVAYTKGRLRLQAFANLLRDGEAPSLVATGLDERPVRLLFDTHTYDLEMGNSHVIAGKHILSYGANARRNLFDLSLAPQAKDRTELGAYLQEDVFLGRVRFVIGGRVDKFGVIGHPVFSPRLAAILKPGEKHSVRLSLNRAFRSPSAVNNSAHETFQTLLNPADFGGSPFAQVPPFWVPVHLQGNPDLDEESLTAYELAYTGVLFGRTHLTVAAYVNDSRNVISLVTSTGPPPRFRVPPYTSLAPPPGWKLPLTVLDQLAAIGRGIPSTVTYLNLGPLRNKGFEVSVERPLVKGTGLSLNYSYQDRPRPRRAPEPYPKEQLSFPPRHRVNASLNVGAGRLFGGLAVNFASEAVWNDVLDFRFHGPTDAYTSLNGSLGMRWAHGRVITTVKATNILDRDLQQHIFGDIFKRNVVGEVRLRF